MILFLFYLQGTLEALKELSTFFTENTLNGRRNLRSKIEQRSLIINEDFLAAFEEVKNTLDDMYHNVSAMNNSVQTMSNRLQTTKSRTLQLIDQTTKLQNERFHFLFFQINIKSMKNFIL